MSDSQRGVEMVFAEDSIRAIFHDMCELRGLSNVMLNLHVTMAESVAMLDGFPEDKPLAVQYYHPDLVEYHYTVHTTQGRDMPHHPDDRSDCKVCQTHLLLVAYEGSKPD